MTTRRWKALLLGGIALSLAVVFLPLVFMSGIVGRIFREFAVTIMVSIIMSGVVSLTLTPLMCARMLAQRGRASYTGERSRDSPDAGAIGVAVMLEAVSRAWRESELERT